MTDSNGVHLISGLLQVSFQDVGIGAAPQLSHDAYAIGNFSQANGGAFEGFGGLTGIGNDNLFCPTGETRYGVYFGSHADGFCGTGPLVPSRRDNGATLLVNGDGTYVYTTANGTRYTFGMVFNSNVAKLSSIQTPDGRITVITSKFVSVGSTTLSRIQSVSRNDGLQLKYRYASDATPTDQFGVSWRQLISITAINNAIDYCAPAADVCSYTKSWPVATYTTTSSGTQSIFTITDMGGGVTRYTNDSVANVGLRIVAIKPPTSVSADTIQITYCPLNDIGCLSQGVKAIVRDGQTWHYTAAYGTGGPVTYILYKSTSPTGREMVAVSNSGMPGPIYTIDSENIPNSKFWFDASSKNNRMTALAYGDGDRLDFSYDARGNVIQTVHTPVSGSPLSAVTTSANFDAICTNPLTCNRANWTRDGRQNQTDYTYSPTHGGTLTATLPANADGIRPQTRYSYTQRYARYKDSTGTVVQAATPIWVLSQSAYCRTGAAISNGCSAAGDEIVTAYDYGPTTGANNLFLRGVAVTADGMTLRTCYGYDDLGNRISETPPKAALGSCP